MSNKLRLPVSNRTFHIPTLSFNTYLSCHPALFTFDEFYSTWESPNPDPRLGVEFLPWRTELEPGQVPRHQRTNYDIASRLGQPTPFVPTQWRGITARMTGATRRELFLASANSDNGVVKIKFGPPQAAVGIGRCTGRAMTNRRFKRRLKFGRAI